MNIGFGMRNIITELKRKDVITNTQTVNFFTDVTKFIIPMDYPLMKLKIIISVQYDKITEQFTNFTDSQLKLYAEKFCYFDSSTKDLEEFYFNDIDLQSFKESSFLMKIILTLSHGQASVERSFSVNNTVINVTMSEDPIRAEKIIKVI